MTKKVFPLELTKSTEELKKLIAEHPDYPIVVLAGECANSGDFACLNKSYEQCRKLLQQKISEMKSNQEG